MLHPHARLVGAPDHAVRPRSSQRSRQPARQVRAVEGRLAPPITPARGIEALRVRRAHEHLQHARPPHLRTPACAPGRRPRAARPSYRIPTCEIGRAIQSESCAAGSPVTRRATSATSASSATAAAASRCTPHLDRADHPPTQVRLEPNLHPRTAPAALRPGRAAPPMHADVRVPGRRRALQRHDHP